jgi:hypothetical protein
MQSVIATYMDVPAGHSSAPYVPFAIPILRCKLCDRISNVNAARRPVERKDGADGSGFAAPFIIVVRINH